MESFFVGISISAVGGLAWLSYHHSKFATRILCAILILTLLTQGGFLTWHKAWNDSHNLAKNSVLLAFASIDSSVHDNIEKPASADNLKKYTFLRTEIQRIKIAINCPLENAASRTQAFITDVYIIFYTIYAITLGLIVLSILFQTYKAPGQQKP